MHTVQHHNGSPTAQNEEGPNPYLLVADGHQEAVDAVVGAADQQLRKHDRPLQADSVCGMYGGRLSEGAGAGMPIGARSRMCPLAQAKPPSSSWQPSPRAGGGPTPSHGHARRYL